MGRWLSTSPQAAACLTEHVLRWTLGESPSSTVVARVQAAAEEDGFHLHALVRAAVHEAVR